MRFTLRIKMRLNTDYQIFIKNYWSGKADVFLFGSRTNDAALGGDIDIALVTDKPIHHSEIYQMKELFYHSFGKQKIDIKVIQPNDNTAFAKHIMAEAIQL